MPSARRGVPSGLLQEASRHSVLEIDHHGLQLRLTLCSKHLYRRVILVDDFAYPAQCDFDAINHDPSWIAGQPARYMYSSMALLLYGYVRGLVPLFPGLWQPVAAWLKDHIRRRMDRWFDHGTRYHRRLLHSHRTRAVELARMLLGVMLALYEISYTAIHMGIYVIASDAWAS
jgi:hypothetical protein